MASSGGDAPALLHDGAEVGALEVLHHEVRRAAVEHAGVHHARDVLARDARRGLALAKEARDRPGHLARDGEQELERHALIELRVSRRDDDAHAAGAEDALDLELAGEDLAGLHRRRRSGRQSRRASCCRSGVVGAIAGSTRGERASGPRGTVLALLGIDERRASHRRDELRGTRRTSRCAPRRRAHRRREAAAPEREDRLFVEALHNGDRPWRPRGHAETEV